ncbi:hypothetical protein GAGA_0372 [Paraglaciecola agarilytica NO2]|uniref:Uncharacterized protein n=1 Tax=Paraglaciecola agarilytica NO2 TaxID=1125747 RepID=A0ABQ0I1R3_9ALTE|nr:hypothetical protein GAGA_0372 [Paraglaciecola agarilytica NO2]
MPFVGSVGTAVEGFIMVFTCQVKVNLASRACFVDLSVTK